MTKKKAKKKATGKAAGKKATKAGASGRSRTTGSKRKQMDPAKVREEIAGLVKAGAPKIAEAVIVQATQGDLARTKYLFEMAGIFPRPVEGDQTTEEEDCLAKTLLARLDAAADREPEKSGAANGADKENKPAAPAPVEQVVV